MSARRLKTRARSASRVLKAIANERRLMVLRLLSDTPHCVSDLEEQIGISQSALSQHLAILRRHGLVTTRRQGQRIIYALKGPEPRKLLDAVSSLYGL